MTYSFGILALLATTCAAFSLNVSGPDWDYTTKDLANTTSQACQDAYSAEIDCDDTLVGLVASMRPGFSPTTADFDNTCTDTCKSSLETYIKNVQAACTQPGDKSEEFLGGSCDPCKFKMDPVELVGQIFQYTLAQSCAKDDEGNYCYGNEYYGDDASFLCSDTCSMQFFTNAHQYAASAYEFNYYALVSRGDWWAQQFQDGWKTVQSCEGDSGDDTAAASTKSEGYTRVITAPAATSTVTNLASPSAARNGTSSKAKTTTSRISAASAVQTGSSGIQVFQPCLGITVLAAMFGLVLVA